jgi:PTS system nitrogen regulatory IIA component
MRIGEVIREGAIRHRLAARDRDGVVAELTDALVTSGGLPAAFREEALIAVFKREALGATALGCGIAVPHARFARTRDFLGAFGVSEAGLPFAAPDGLPVHAVFLLLSPTGLSEDHLRLMGTIAQLTSSPSFVKEALAAPDAAALRKLLLRAEEFGGNEGPPEQDEPALI